VSDSVDFRDVSAALHHAVFEEHRIDLATNRFELTAASSHTEPGKRISLIFEGVTAFRWHSKPASSASIDPSIVGLERLGAAEPWRLYLSLPGGGEIELTCARILSGGTDGAEVTGIGRSYRH
jgi:hypothetical protein